MLRRQRRPHRGPPQQRGAEQQLGDRERGVPGARGVQDQPGERQGRAGDPGRAAHVGGHEDLVREAPAEHERLELQRAVGQPEHAERDLEAAPQSGGFPVGGPGPQAGRRGVPADQGLLGRGGQEHGGEGQRRSGGGDPQAGAAPRGHHRVGAQRPHAGRELEEQESGEPGGQEAGQADHPPGQAAAAQGVGEPGQGDDGPGGGQHPPVAAAHAGDADQPGERGDPGQERPGDHDGPGGQAAEPDGPAPAAQRCGRPAGCGPARRPGGVHGLVNHAWHLSCRSGGRVG